MDNVATVQPPMLEAGSDRTAVRAREDYVKAIYQLGRTRVSGAEVARRLGVSAVAVSKAKRLLERDRLIQRDPRGRGLRLTRSGRELAVAIVRRHRLLETFLHRLLGVPLDCIHAEAERIEHVISDDIAERLAVLLGHPSHDPHGHEIPYARDAATSDGPLLADVASGATIEVLSLDDRDANALRALAASGVLPGLSARVARDDQAIRLLWENGEARVTPAHATLVRVK